MADWNSKIIEEFRANEGKVGGPFDGSVPDRTVPVRAARPGGEVDGCRVGAVQGDHGRRYLGGRLRPGRCGQEMTAGQPGSPLGHRSQGPCSH